MTIQNRRFLLASRPNGEPTVENFKMDVQEIDPAQLPDGHVLIKMIYISVDPYMRSRMNERNEKTYIDPFAIGDVFGGENIGQVIESKNAKFSKGDFVRGFFLWQEYAIVNGDDPTILKLDLHGAPLSAFMSVLGTTGLTAYFGLLKLCLPKAGETVVVSGAAGATGSFAGQIAKIKGCRVVGIAGGPDKCKIVTSEFGFDACVDYKAANNDLKILTEKIREACPNGVDAYFDNVGGVITDAVFNNLNVHARISICGSISTYNAEVGKDELGPRHEPRFIAKRCRMEGFLVTDFLSEFPTGAKDMAQWFAEGKLKYRETIVEGFEKTPQAFLDLFKGTNIGKQLVKAAEPM